MSVTQKLLERIAEAVTTAGETVRSEIQAGLAQTRNGLTVRAAALRPVYPNTVTNAGTGRLIGWSLRETSGTNPVVVTLYDSRDNSGDVVAQVSLAAGAVSNHGLPGAGVSFGEALFAEVTGAGTVRGPVYLGAVD